MKTRVLRMLCSCSAALTLLGSHQLELDSNSEHIQSSISLIVYLEDMKIGVLVVVAQESFIIMLTARRFLAAIWFVVCTIGCCWQIRKLSIEYFSYGMITRVDVNYEDMVDYPNVSICFYMGDTVKWSQLFLKEPSMMEAMKFTGDPADEDTIKKFEFHLRLKSNHQAKIQAASNFMKNRKIESIFNFSMGTNDLFSNCTYLNPKKLHHDIEAMFQRI